jgi:hypothetical protein
MRKGLSVAAPASSRLALLHGSTPQHHDFAAPLMQYRVIFFWRNNQMHYAKCVRVALLLAGFMLGTNVLAQTAENLAAVARLRSLVSADSRAPINRGPTRASLVFTDSETAATATFNVKDYETASTSQNLQLTVTGPLGKTAQSSTLFSNDGVPASVSLGASYSITFRGDPASDTSSTPEDRVQGFYRGSPVRRQPTSDTLQATIARKLARNVKDVTSIGVSLIASRPEFAFVPTSDTTLTSTTETRRAISASAGIGRTLGLVNGLIGLSYQRTIAFQGGVERTLCRPIPSTSATQCSAAVLGAPTQVSQSLINAELRAFFPTVAIAPRISWDTERSKWGLTLPLYLFQNEKGSFVGGISGTVAQGSKRLGYSLFIGRALSNARWW